MSQVPFSGVSGYVYSQILGKNVAIARSGGGGCACVYESSWGMGRREGKGREGATNRRISRQALYNPLCGEYRAGGGREGGRGSNGTAPIQVVYN